MLEALSYWQNRYVAGVGEATGSEQPLQAREHPGGPGGLRDTAIDEVRTGKVQA